MALIVGTANADTLNGTSDSDTITGLGGDDIINGNDGNDSIDGGDGNDTLRGGLGFDSIIGGAGNDTAFLTVATDGSDSINLGDGGDVLNVTAAAGSQVRLTFTSAEVGNNSALDGIAMANQDGGLAVRLQAEDGADGLTGAQTRTDDEGITFIASTGSTFDVRDLVSGVQRGNAFEVVILGISNAEVQTALQTGRSYYINAGMGDDTVSGGDVNDFLVGGAGNDVLNGGAGNDSFIGGGGNDTINGGTGNDTAFLTVASDGADAINLGDGGDVVSVTAAAGSQIRLTFTSAEVGNNTATDGNAMTNQDGGLAVRLQAEDGADGLTGSITRIDDEGTTFVASAGATFDVRDLVSGVQRGNAFEVVVLGISNAEVQTAAQAGRSYYINAGAGDDSVSGGNVNDFLVGGSGNDTLDGGLGDDNFIGGAGNDTIIGSAGNDTATLTVATDGSDAIDLGDGSDIVNVTAATGSQVRLTFTSSEVGNGATADSNTMTNQDGRLAVRLQAEDGSDGLTGAVSRIDDEGITFIASTGATFDVRDLVSGVQRGNAFEIVTLGTSAADTLTAVQASRAYYFNGGQGNDTITGGTANDFIVGGAGNDVLSGGAGNDSFIGGGGNDTITGGTGNDTALLTLATDGSDTIDLGEGGDVVNVTAAAGSQIRLTFTSAEVGNNIATDGNALTNQDGGLAVRLQGEDGVDGLTGAQTRVDDEGTTFVASAGVTFDVRDLVSGAQRGNFFEFVVLGTSNAEIQTAAQAGRSYYINGGGGDDVLIGSSANDFLVGGAGNDRLEGGDGDDTFIGGGGADSIVGGAGNDTHIVNISTEDRDNVDLGTGNDTVRVTATVTTATPVEIRLTFNSSEVGDGNVGNATSGLAVRMQAEDASGEPGNPLFLYDDEGITFIAETANSYFDVRDLATGVARGNRFEVVRLGTADNDIMDSSAAPGRSYYHNGGAGNDVIFGGTTDDFIVGGTGNDTLIGGRGNDQFLGGAGDDGFEGGVGADVLNGGAGRDNFAYRSVAEGGDIIQDFNAADDTLQFIAGAFGQTAGGTANLVSGTNPTATSTQSAFLYNTTTGVLSYDADGTGAGAAVVIATLIGAPTLTTADFFFV